MVDFKKLLQENRHKAGEHREVSEVGCGLCEQEDQDQEQDQEQETPEALVARQDREMEAEAENRRVIIDESGEIPSSLWEAEDYSEVAPFMDRSKLFQYVGGPAGCGKTFLMKALEQRDPSVLLTSTTGIAAINLGGTTINSALGYYDTLSLRESLLNGWVQARLAKYKKSGITTWVIDEASMMDGNQLQYLAMAMKEVNDREIDYRGDPLSRNPIRLILVGDFAQLPPVDGPFVFEQPEWELFEPNQTLLTGTKRQTDPGFIEALRAARRGDGKKALEFFRDRLSTSKDDLFEGPTIMATNKEVDRYNEMKLRVCGGEEIRFKSFREGKAKGEWKNIPEELVLKEGALVMVLANSRIPETRDYYYVNGDLGTLVGWKEVPSQRDRGQVWDPVKEEWQDPVEYPPLMAARVKLQRTGAVETVVPVLRQNLVPTGNKGVKEPRFKVEGWLEYTPLKLAWASTCHKSQGLSLDSVQVSLANPFFGTGGMVYVALSRARTPGGLRLVATPDMFVARCNPDERVRRWL